MKKYFFLSLLLLFCCSLNLSAQSPIKFKSENFYGNSITEYIHLYIPQYSKGLPGLEVYYFTSQNPNKIRLNVIKVTEGQSGNDVIYKIDVSFPNDTAIYSLVHGMASLNCIDPNGKKQEYELIWK